VPTAPPVPDDALSALVRAGLAAPARCGTTRVVAVDGRSGSGKSQLTTALARALAASAGGRPGGPVVVVRLDDVYPGWDGLLGAVPLLRRWLLQPLAAGYPAGHHTYDWARGTFGTWRPVTPGGVLLLEGVGSGAAALAPYRGLLVWVQAPDGVRRERAIRRDGETFARHWDRWAAQEEEYLRRDDPRAQADLVVDTGGPAALLPPALSPPTPLSPAVPADVTRGPR
jgi:uridine kinase